MFVFAKNLTALRKKFGLTQEQLAIKLNLSSAAVSKWEKGKSTPDIETIVSLADFFGVTLDALLLSERLTPERIDSIAKEYFDIFVSKGYTEALKYRDSVYEAHPKDDNLKISLAMVMQQCEIFVKNKKYENFLESEQEALLLKASQNTNIETANLAKYLLSAFYIRIKEFEKAEKYLNSIEKEIYGDKDELLLSVYMCKKDFASAEMINRKLLMTALNGLNNALFTKTILALKEGDNAKSKKLHSLHKKIFRLMDGDKLYGHLIATAGIEIAVKTQDRILMLDSLESYIDICNKDMSKYETKLFGLEVKPKSETEKKYDQAILKTILEDLNDNKNYDFVRDEKRFMDIFTKLNELYKKENH